MTSTSRRNPSRGPVPDVQRVHYNDTNDTDDDTGVSFFPVRDDDSFMSVRGGSSCSESSEYANKMQKGDTAGFDTQGERTGMLPREILNMDKRSIELYNRALQEGEEKTHCIRLMVVGHYGVGKTTLTKRLFKENVDIKERKSTDGIDVHVGRCKISLKDGTWFTSPTYAGGNKKNVMQRLAKIMQTTSNEKEQIKSATASSITTTAVETNMKLEQQSKRNEEMAEPPQSGTLEIIRTEDEIMDAQTDTKTEIAASMREHGEIPKVKTGKENKTSLRTNVYTPFQDKHRDVTKGGSNKNIFRRLCNLIPVGKKGNSVASSNVNTSVETIEVKREVPKRWRPFLHRDSIVSITSTIPDTKDLAETGTTSRSVDSLRKSGTNQDTAKAKIEDNVRKDLQEVINEVRHDVFNKDEVLCDLSLWDFAGQNIFYATHQAFLSQRAIYLLVLDISKHIDDTVQDDIWHFDCHGEQECKVAEFIEFWLNSIHEFCSIPGENGPPVILVGTFVDKLEKRSDAERCFFNMQSTLIKKSTNCHLTKRQFDIDNTVDGDENVEELKKHIVEIAAKQSYWGERIPAKWIALEVRLIRLKEEQNMKGRRHERRYLT
ncbi:probable serine/threonine-protein kinase roco6 isoform X2 [Mercenaria mercenaria]|uniref:probable serine/threonine-protein kinase roco6 isoform X2 n=1 Tax=Mercenaria mercenaria TaxID=6596 RepID=UPI00234F2126|nr:probable serine/threonine-protein kinase roco6 isoform X2 [Mercenaria mercenaria]